MHKSIESGLTQLNKARSLEVKPGTPALPEQLHDVGSYTPEYSGPVPERCSQAAWNSMESKTTKKGGKELRARGGGKMS